MADDPENLTPRYLRRLDEKLDRLIDDIGDLKARATAVEEGLAGVNRRIDRLENRMDRIERRLNLQEA
ncbi:hypothetical protein L2U69_10145 [Zavarzinia compransoris]|uniref:hypothetical protein n=1 Tax=Zavarzinia marina TaxID=2911065 RepID=UPI001F2B1720|nr:hypothetical protein [Zavarzinia marina]MCF4166004.1 hypothetical protein [Zavarzinia marina]